MRHQSAVDRGVIASYRMSSGPRLLQAGLIVLMGLLGIGLVVGAARGYQPGWFYAVLWYTLVGGNAHRFLWRVAYRLDLTQSALRWRSELREGVVPLGEVTRVHRWSFASRLVAFEVGGGPPLVVMAGPGFGAFCEEFARAVPGARMDYHGRYAASR